MNKKIVALSLLAIVSAHHSCQAGFFSQLKNLMGSIGSTGIISGNQRQLFTWKGRPIYWVDKGQSITKVEKRDLSNCKGPFSVKNAVGKVEVYEGAFPHLIVQKVLHPESMNDVETIINQNNTGTIITLEFKNNKIKGKSVNYMLCLPKSEKVNLLSTISGSIIAKYSGILRTVRSDNGSIKVEGASSPSSKIDLDSSNGKIEAGNITGDVNASTSNGRINLYNINGNAIADTSNGKIGVENVDGNVKAETSNGRIDAHNIKGNVRARTSNGKIELNKISGSVDAKSDNSRVYRDGQRIDKNFWS